MGERYLGVVTAFTCPAPTEARKAQRCKLLEEAGEAFASAQGMEELEDNMPHDLGLREMLGYDVVGSWQSDLADELADVVQAVVNLASAHGITPDDLTEAMVRCQQRNHERGRV